MDSTTVGIILGILIAGIIALIVFQVIVDRKKKRKLKKQRDELTKLEQKVLLEVVAKVNSIIEVNQHNLDNFVVSIGERKMKDIIFWAKSNLKEVTETEEYKKAFIDNPFEKNELLQENIEILIASRSNGWSKRNSKEIEYFQELEKVFLEKDESKDTYLERKTTLKGEYLLNEK
ncbi:MHJ_0274 family protein [Mesomycoplasma lagogenitalium]|uniref:Uncharacterized protein n=1 Tax=Mesomycoplasma lagogenitalium TaxID=171286 RepID=A0ABY8LUA6_9BACT|nr:hypothetical protein [Mesomycoplasma lagogenitalium]WGI36814.1 hypothetical protein QEG99_00805 [Mesomycoplasma lagogenitalium]